MQSADALVGDRQNANSKYGAYLEDQDFFGFVLTPVQGTKREILEKAKRLQ